MADWESDSAKIVFLVPQELQRNIQACNNTKVDTHDTEILQTTFRIYGTFFAVLFILFCLFRVKFKKAYNVRAWVQRIRCPLAVENHYGYIDWVWHMWFDVTDDELREQCGMDALCFIRLLRFGLGISVVGMFNSLWLVPSYATAPYSCETKHVQQDWFAMATISNLQDDSPRLLGTVIGIYIVFGYVFYQLLRDLEWFTRQRHIYLSRHRIQNYSVYVAHIPPEFQSNQALLSYFRRSDHQIPSVVLEAHIAMDIPALEAAVKRRDALVRNLEHAINVQNVMGRTPTHRDLLRGNMVSVNSINTWTEQLVEANADVRQRIEEVEQRMVLQESRRLVEAEQDEKEESSFYDAAAELPVEEDGSNHEVKTDVEEAILEEANEPVAFAATGDLLAPQKPMQKPQASLPPSKDDISDKQDKSSDSNSNSSFGLFDALRHAGSAAVETAGDLATSAVETAGDLATSAVETAGDLATTAMETAGDLATTAVELITGTEDGRPREAGFVTFTKISRAQAALQMLHHPTPFNFIVQEAPEPDDVWWKNVGRSHQSLQIAVAFSIALTVALCLFWTVPVAFVAGLAEVESLKRTLPFLEDWVAKAPWLEGFLEQLAPLLIMTLNTILPYILEFISRIEGPISDALNQNSAFRKFSTFMIIQTFFISAISGSIWSALKEFIDSPELIVSVLATSLIGQSTYFVQILLVQTFVGLGMQLLRVVPITYSFLRKCIGPNLTEKERNTAVFGFIRPLGDVYKLEHFRVLSFGLLYFMVAFVYSAIAPLTNFFLGFCFLLMIIAYKHQFVYIYPTKPDTGGKMWTSFIRICLPCVLIAQFALIGMLLLKQSALATPFMAPLIVATVLS